MKNNIFLTKSNKMAFENQSYLKRMTLLYSILVYTNSLLNILFSTYISNINNESAANFWATITWTN